jgi:hypothetical protein
LNRTPISIDQGDKREMAFSGEISARADRIDAFTGIGEPPTNT